ncbi:MAG: carbohydrate ABC transporter permease [Methanosarcinales archaeon]
MNSKLHLYTSYGILLIYTLFTIIPILWVFSTSLKPGEEAMHFPPSLIPSSFTLENYKFVFTDPYLVRGLINSFIVSISGMVLCVAISALAGYSFARYRFSGKNIIISVMLGMFMIPVVMNVIPLYIMLGKLGLLNTYTGLILTYQILIIPLNVFLLKNYFETIPRELEDAAMVDGCSRIGAFLRVTLPLAWPGLAVASIFSFRFAWNEFIFAYTFTSKPEMHVFQVALFKFMGLYRINWGYLTACIMIGMLPVLIMLIFFQEQMAKGLTMGAIKG